MKKNQILEFLNGGNDDFLFAESNRIRKLHCGDNVYIRGLIEFSNCCVRNCCYCGLRQDNGNLNRYRMNVEEISTVCRQIAENGIKTVVLQSGDDFYYTRQMICDLILRIKKDYPEMAVTLSIGERPLDDYNAFKDYGADRYLIRHETANEQLYEKLHPGQNLKTRLNILDYLRKTGFQIGCGCIAGLPYQTIDDLAEDILLMKKIQPDMAGIGPFIPQKDTPLKDFPQGNAKLLLRVLALTRIVTKNAYLPATTALATIHPESGHVEGLRAGANVLMPVFTPANYGRDYKIYNDKARISFENAKQDISKANRLLCLDRGDSLKTGQLS